MAFDLSSAQPAQSSGFDLASAQPVGASSSFSAADLNPMTSPAMGDAALSLASGAVAAPIAGLSGMAAAFAKALNISDTEAADVVRKVQDALTIQPKTAGGQAIAGAVSKPFEKLAEVGTAAGEKVTDATGSPLLGAAADTLIQGAPMALGKVAPKVKGALADSAARIAVEQAPLREQIKAATDAGYVLTPNEAKAGLVSRSTEGLAGSAKLQKGASAKNQEATNRQIRADIGLDENTPAKPEAIQAIIDEAHKPYEAVKRVGGFTNDEQYLADIDKVTASQDTAAKSYAHRTEPTSAEERFNKTVDGLKSSAAPDTAAAVEEVKLLRADAKKAFKTGDDRLGAQYRALAEAVDSSMDRALQRMSENIGADPALAKAVADYRAARVKIAKAYQAESALGTDGNFDANTYAKMLDKGVPLSGPALTVANFAKTFPKLAQQAQKVGHFGIDFGDLALSVLSGGGGVLATHAATGGAGAAALVARPLARSALLSGPAQRAITSGSKPLNSAGQAAAELQSSPITQGAEMGTGDAKRRDRLRYIRSLMD